ncbi:MAG TPA: hypothetical protein VHD62_08485 [Opitutaceae bacterium]|nr:hypothetical protein [Opitutaceae bacterium]
MKLRVLTLVALWSLASSTFAAETKSAEPAPAPTPAPLTAEQKAALEIADNVIAKFAALLAKDDDARHRAATQLLLDDYKKRRDALHQEFDQSRYDELRIDLNLEYQRLARWMAPPNNPPPAKNSANTAPAK